MDDRLTTRARDLIEQSAAVDAGDRRQQERRRTVSPKIPCPHCAHGVSTVQSDWSVRGTCTDGGYRRVRRCVACRCEFMTVERVEYFKKPAA